MTGEKNWERQLLALRALTASTGILHDAQVHQLKMWGAFIFLGRGKWTATPDLENKTVTYELLEKKRNPAKFASMAAGLERSIHWLLGDDWLLVIKRTGVPIYQGERILTDVANERNTRSSDRKSEASSD